MKNTTRALLVAIAFFIPALFGATEAQSQDAAQPPMNGIAVINIDRIMKESLAMQDITRQIDGYRGVFEKDILAEQDLLRAKQAQLEQQAPSLDAKSLDEQKAAFRQDIANYERAAQDRLRALEEVQIAAVDIVRDALADVIRDFAFENRIGLVMSQKSTVFVVAALEVTDIVLDRLNQKLSAVKVTSPSTVATQ